MTTASLGIAVDSSSADRATISLSQLTRSAQTAETATKGVEGSSAAAARALTGKANAAVAAERAALADARASLAAAKASGTASKEDIAAARSARDKAAATLAASRASFEHARAAATVEGAAAAEARALNGATAAANANARAMQVAGAASRLAMNNSRQLSFQLIDMGQALATAPTMGIYALQNLGFQVAQIGQLYMGQGGFSAAIKDSTRQVAAFAARMGPLGLAIGGVAAVIANMRSEINRTSDVTVSFGDVALGVFQAVRDNIYGEFQPAISAVSGWLSATWEAVLTRTKEMGNLVINTMTAVGFAIEEVWKGMPGVLGGAMVAAGDAVLSAIESMMNGTLERLNMGVRAANAIVEAMPGKAPGWAKIGTFDPIDLPGMPNPWANTPGGQSIGAGIAERMGRDPLGNLGRAGSANAISNALSKVEEGADKAGKSLKDAANDNIHPWTDLGARIDEAKGIVGSFFTDLRTGLQNGEGFWGSFKGAALNAIEAIASKIQTNLIDNLFSLNAAGGGGGLLGGLTSLLGFGLPAGGLFASGGYTGAGGTHEPAGIVHRGEYVMSAAAVNRLGVGYLDALHGAARGYAGGGYVEPSPGVCAGEPGGFGERLAA